MPSLSYRLPRKTRASSGGGPTPGNTVAPAVTGTTTEGQALSTTNGTWSNSPTSYGYQWKRDGSWILGATASTYTLTGADVGALITCTVTAFNADGAGQATSNAVGPIVSLAPTYVSGASITGVTTQGQTLTAVPGTWTGTPSYAYQWKRGGADISGATAGTYVLQFADVGQTITVAITGTNGYGSASTTTAGVGPVASGAPAYVSGSAVSGTTQVGSTLSASAGTWTGAPSFTYQWQRGGIDVAGATAGTYTLVSGDLGANIRCVITGTNGFGSASISTAAVGPITSASPPTGPALLKEDGGYLLKEDGGRILLETLRPPALLKEDGFYLLKEDGGRILIENAGPPALLKEDGGYLLKEDGARILLDLPAAPALLKEDGAYLLKEDGGRLLLEFGEIPAGAILDPDGIPILDPYGNFVLEP